MNYLYEAFKELKEAKDEYKESSFMDIADQLYSCFTNFGSDNYQLNYFLDKKIPRAKYPEGTVILRPDTLKSGYTTIEIKKDKKVDVNKAIKIIDLFNSVAEEAEWPYDKIEYEDGDSRFLVYAPQNCPPQWRLIVPEWRTRALEDEDLENAIDDFIYGSDWSEIKKEAADKDDSKKKAFIDSKAKELIAKEFPKISKALKLKAEDELVELLYDTELDEGCQDKKESLNDTTAESKKEKIIDKKEVCEDFSTYFIIGLKDDYDHWYNEKGIKVNDWQGVNDYFRDSEKDASVYKTIEAARDALEDAKANIEYELNKVQPAEEVADIVDSLRIFKIEYKPTKTVVENVCPNCGKEVCECTEITEGKVNENVESSMPVQTLPVDEVKNYIINIPEPRPGMPPRFFKLGYIKEFGPEIPAKFKGGRGSEDQPKVRIFKCIEYSALYTGADWRDTNATKAADKELGVERHTGEKTGFNFQGENAVEKRIGSYKDGSEALQAYIADSSKQKVKFFISLNDEDLREADKEEIAQYLTPAHAVKVLGGSARVSAGQDAEGNAVYDKPINRFKLSNIYMIGNLGHSIM